MADEGDVSRDDGEQEPPQRSSAAIGLITTVLLCGLALALFIFYARKTDDVSGQAIDMAEVPAGDSTPAAAPGGGTFGIAPAGRPSGSFCDSSMRSASCALIDAVYSKSLMPASLARRRAASACCSSCRGLEASLG